MAVLDRAFGALPLFGMEYHQTPHSFLQGTNAPLLGTSVGELGQINSLPVSSGLNSNGFYCMQSQFNANSGHVEENGHLFLGVLPQTPEGNHALSQTTCTGSHLGRSRKHRLREDTSDCPVKKRRVSTSSKLPVIHESAAPGIFAGDSGQPFWASSDSQVKEAAIIPTVADQSSTMMVPVPTEDMEEVAVESLSDAAIRRIRDIESRLVVEDDEEEENNSRSSVSHLPTLVMSDVLVEGFKKGLDESLTRKIVDSINRPSMEIVLWKPQPEFLVNKLQNIASRCETDKEMAKKIQRTAATPLIQELPLSSADEPYTSNLGCDIDSIWNREDEEMEL
ncbi:hypothetical protein GDO81_002437 [Engystomops pustulosus]|nr:hypothetical protein GDO81_002437 [Engystomops pustulosus]